MQIYPPGARIGQYEIASNPMIGGMGVVYFCLDHGNDGRPVALKTFKPEYLPDRAARDRFLREGSAWVKLGRHPHIVCCYKVEYIDPTAFLVLELIAKEQDRDDASLRSWLGAPMPLEQALLFALQIARGMKHATEKIPGFVHRDLKPENILVGADRLLGTNINRLRITDFGLATVLKDEGGNLESEEVPETLGHTHLTHGIVGTPLYMAPEQWKGAPVGTYTDIYAFGCILYEMLTGQRLASGNSISELQVAHCAGKLRPLPAAVPSEVRDILIYSLSLRPAQRYQSWAEVTGALERAYEMHGLGSVWDGEAVEGESIEEHKQLGWSYNAMGHAYFDMGKAQVAAGYFEQQLVIAREVGDRHGEGAVLGNLGVAYGALGNARRAIEFFEQALVIDREIGDRRGEGTDLGNLGNVYLNLGDANSAIGFFEQALVIDREIGDRRGEGTSLGNLGIAYAAVGDPRYAIGFYEQSLEIEREIGDRRGEGKFLGGLGNAYADLGDIRRAIEFHEQRLAIAHEIGDRRGEGNALGDLGATNAALGDLRRAITFYEQSLEIARGISNRRGEGNALGNLGAAYATLGDANSAIGFFEQQLELHHETGDLNGVASVSFNMAIFYAQQGEFARALPLAQEAAQVFARIGHPKHTQRAQQLIARLQDNAPAANSAQAALDAFQCAESLQAMQVAVVQHPMLKDRQFIQLIQKIIAEQIPPEDKSTFDERLACLKQIAEF